MGFRFVMEAKERGATIIHVDPRFTRTSAVADIYAPMRSGTDIAFLGGIINYVLANERYFKEYVVGVHQRELSGKRVVQGYRGSRRALLWLRSRDADLRFQHVVVGARRERPHQDRSRRCSTSAAC